MKQNDKDHKSHYCVLYTQTLKQWEVTTVLKKTLPEGRGTVFYPCMELWRHDRKATEIRALFPGYLFVRSDMEPEELHHFIREHRGDVASFIKELRVTEKKMSDGDVAEKANGTDEYQYIRMDLKKDETEFLDFLLACGKDDRDSEEGGDVEGEADVQRNGMGRADVQRDGIDREDVRRGNIGSRADAQRDGTCKDNMRRDVICRDGRGEGTAATPRVPMEGVLRMSYGYREGGKYVVMKGPLKEYQHRIAKVNAHDRKAYLDIKINGRAVRAGFEVKPKRYWFPDDTDAPMVLNDGTEVNLEKLRNIMMGSKQKDKHSLSGTT